MLGVSFIFTLFLAFYGLDTIVSLVFGSDLSFNPYLRTSAELNLLLGNPLQIFGFVSTFLEPFAIASFSKIRFFLFGSFWLLNSCAILVENHVKEKIIASLLFIFEVLCISLIVIHPESYSPLNLVLSLLAPMAVCLTTIFATMFIQRYRR